MHVHAAHVIYCGRGIQVWLVYLTHALLFTLWSPQASSRLSLY